MSEGSTGTAAARAGSAATREIRLTVKNYRCFPAQRPARLTLRPGFTSLIGVNNAGKSTLLKLMYELRDVFNQAVGGQIRNAALPNNWVGFSNPQEITDPKEIFAKLGTGYIELHIEAHGYGPSPSTLPLQVTAITFTIDQGRWHAQLWTGDQEVAFEPNTGIGISGSILYQGTPKADLTAIMPALGSLVTTLYIGPFRNAVNIGAHTTYYDLQIGSAFIAQWRNLQTGANRSQNEAVHALTEEIRRIFGFRELLINPTSQNDNFQLIIDGQSRRLNEVGAGLAQFVVCLANAATQRPSWILIDEPELNLHPRLQSDFLEALGSLATEGVAYATHSLGLARSHAQQVYSVRQIRSGESEVVPYAATPRLAEFLGELGYAALRDIGYDRLLLIEGPNDIQTIKTMLRWYDKEHGTILVPLGG